MSLEAAPTGEDLRLNIGPGSENRISLLSGRVSRLLEELGNERNDAETNLKKVLDTSRERLVSFVDQTTQIPQVLLARLLVGFNDINPVSLNSILDAIREQTPAKDRRIVERLEKELAPIKKALERCEHVSAMRQRAEKLLQACKNEGKSSSFASIYSREPDDEMIEALLPRCLNRRERQSLIARLRRQDYEYITRPLPRPNDAKGNSAPPSPQYSSSSAMPPTLSQASPDSIRKKTRGGIRGVNLPLGGLAVGAALGLGFWANGHPRTVTPQPFQTELADTELEGEALHAFVIKSVVKEVCMEEMVAGRLITTVNISDEESRNYGDLLHRTIRERINYTLHAENYEVKSVETLNPAPINPTPGDWVIVPYSVILQNQGDGTLREFDDQVTFQF